MIHVDANEYKSDTDGNGVWGWTGVVSADYHKLRDNYLGVKVLAFITNCRDRKHALECAYHVEHHLMCIGVTEESCKKYTHRTMPGTYVVLADDLNM